VAKHAPFPLRKEQIRYLLEKEFLLNDFENYRAVWFGTVLSFSDANRKCWQVLWANFLRGNLPIPHERIISAWEGSSTHISYLLKRHDVWTKKIIVGDGRGNYWLQVPPEILRRLPASNAAPANDLNPPAEGPPSLDGP
jgi:hypothetical protein